ncbi:MAG: Sua5/YciO/YrdC/YwlC family protein [Cellvibrionaceae bacterium]
MDWARHPEIRRIGRLIGQGEVIAYPTEAVWGLGCDPHSQAAVNKLLELKNRSVDKGLILVAASIEQLAPYLNDLSTKQRQTLENSWPGPVTWLVPDNGRAPPWIRGDHPAVALRVSAHPIVVALCHACRGPIVSTSANVAGQPEARDASAVERQFGDRLAALAPGEVGSAAKPTEIRDLLTGVVLRKA